MKQKLIITLWKAQFSSPIQSQSLSCRLNYNNQYKSTKLLKYSKTLQWKQTFIFPLSKQQQSLIIQFIPLKKNQQIHYAKQNVAESICIAKAQLKVLVKAPTKGSLPVKLDIIGQNNKHIGILLIQYEILKTQINYMVQKIIDYNYLLKLSNFKVSFLRDLKKTPKFYLKFIYGNGKIIKQDFPFNQQNKQFYYNYPIKFHIDKQLEIEIHLQVKDFYGLDYHSANQSINSSYKQSDKKSQNSQTTKKNALDFDNKISQISKKNTLDLGFDNKISTILDLNIKQNIKISKKLSLKTPYKNTHRQIGSIQFQLQAIFKTQQQKKFFKSQRLESSLIQNHQQLNSPQKKRKPNPIQQSNGTIILKTIMGKLQFFNDDILNDKNISLTLKLGKQIQQSSILQKPGKQLIFIDSFQFKRTWQQTIKIILQLSNQNNDNIKIPTFFASLNLRDLFQQHKITAKKVKIYDQNKQYRGMFTLQMEYKQEQKKNKIPQIDKSLVLCSKLSLQEVKQIVNKQKRQKIAERMKQKQKNKEQIIQQQKISSKIKDRDVFTMAEALDLKNIILPPLKSRKIQNQYSTVSTQRYSTINPTIRSGTKLKSAMVYNRNGSIKFSLSPRFEQPQNSGGSFSFIRESDFDGKRNKGASIGYGQKYDFTRDKKDNPGIGKYQIPTVWDKYN